MGVKMSLNKKDEPRSPAHASLRDAFCHAATGMVIHDFEGNVIDVAQMFRDRLAQQVQPGRRVHKVLRERTAWGTPGWVATSL